MAYQARGRDPFLDTNMALAIERRGKELLGLALIVLGCMAAAMIASYTPEDPSWILASDAPVQNWMGRVGASIAAPLFMIVGWGAWGIAIVLVAWGLRMALHRGEERAIGRLIFAPIAVAAGSVYASTLVPGDGWTHSFGLGGLFGDTVLGAVLTFLPIGATFGLKLLSLLLGIGILAIGAFVLGFTRPELKSIARFLMIGLIMTYAWTMTALGRGAAGAFGAARGLQARQAERREQRRLEAEEAAEWAAQQEAQMQAAPALRGQSRVARAQVAQDPLVEDDDYYDYDDGYDVAPAPQPERTGLFARVTSLARRDPMPEPELVEHDIPRPTRRARTGCAPRSPT